MSIYGNSTISPIFPESENDNHTEEVYFTLTFFLEVV